MGASAGPTRGQMAALYGTLAKAYDEVARAELALGRMSYAREAIDRAGLWRQIASAESYAHGR